MLQPVSSQSIQQNIQQVDAPKGRFSYLTNGASQTLRRLALITIPALALLAFSNMPTAEAGPLAYASCLAGCAAMGPFAPACWPSCLAILALPTP